MLQTAVGINDFLPAVAGAFPPHHLIEKYKTPFREVIFLKDPSPREVWRASPCTATVAKIKVDELVFVSEVNHKFLQIYVSLLRYAVQATESMPRIFSVRSYDREHGIGISSSH